MSLCEMNCVEGVYTLTLNRAEAMNALSQVMLMEMEQCLRAVAQDREARCVVVTGAGEKAFCAGADLKERRMMTQGEASKAVERIGSVIQQMADLPVPTIAAVQGVALGGGLELALACDLRVVGEQATLGLTETRLAIIPGAGGTQRLSRLIGPARAKDLIFTGRKVSGNEALTLGLANRVVPDAAVLATALELAEMIAAGGPVALRAAKEAIDRGLEKTLAGGIDVEREAYQRVLNTEDRLEGLQAFAEKRKPLYKGR